MAKPPLALSRSILVLAVSASALAVFASALIHSTALNARIYSDIWSFWGRQWVSSGQAPYSSSFAFLEYPPVSGAILYAARMIGGAISGIAGSLYDGYYDSFSALSILAAAGIGWSTWRLAKGLGVKLNPLYFLLPTMLMYGVYNFDLFNALFIVLGLQLFVEKRRTLSAASIGLAIATKLVAVVLLPIFFLELSGLRVKLRYVLISLAVAGATLIPIAIYDWGWFGQFINFYGGWGLEDAWYLWAFGSPFSPAAKVFGYALLAGLLLKVYSMDMPLVQRSFLALAAYLFSATIYAPQFNLMLIPLIAVLAVRSPWLFTMEVSNALIILTWFSVPATATSGPTYPWTIPQALALLRSISLALLGISVASASGYSFVAWLRLHLRPISTSAPPGAKTAGTRPGALRRSTGA